MNNSKFFFTFFAITILVSGFSIVLTPITQAQSILSDFQTTLLEGDVTFKVYPDNNVEVKIDGSLEETYTNDQPPPVENVYYEMNLSPSGISLTEIEGSCEVKINPAYSDLLSTLGLDLVVKTMDNTGDATILFNLPGYLRINGKIQGSTEKTSSQSTLDFDITTTIWYTAVPKSNIQELAQNFSTIEPQLASQLYEATKGTIIIQDLTLITSKFDTTSATITVTGKLTGDYNKALIALSANAIATFKIPELPPLNGVKIKSSNLHVTFDKETLTFKTDYICIIEGELDNQINILKNLILTKYLQYPKINQEIASLINDLLLPTEISIVNLNTIFEISFDGEKLDYNFLIDGLRFKPPTTETFLNPLNQLLTRLSLPDFTLTLEGESNEKAFVEIQLPQTASEPMLKTSRKVVWKLDNPVNLNLVSFSVKEWPKPTFTVSQTEIAEGDIATIEGVLTIEGEPVIGHEVKIVANTAVIGTAETDQKGNFTFTYKFEDAGSYNVKTSLDFYEKKVESQTTTVNVNPPPLIPSDLMVPMLGGVVIVAAVVGYIIIKRR